MENSKNSSDNFKIMGAKCNDGKKVYIHCAVGGSRFGMPCGGNGAPSLADRPHLQRYFPPNVDDREDKLLFKLFKKIAELKGAMYLIGDSQMTNLQLGMDCDTIIDGLRDFSFESVSYMNVPGHNHTVDIARFNGPGLDDKTAFKTAFEKQLQYLLKPKATDGTSTGGAGHEYVLIIINFGTHYNVRERYNLALQDLLPYLNQVVLTHNGAVDIFWMETPPQHFNTPNGYWGGSKSKCVPIQNRTQEADWRNYDVAEILRVQPKDSQMRGVQILKVHICFMFYMCCMCCVCVMRDEYLYI